MNRRIVAIIQTLSVLVLMSFGTILTKIVLASIPPLKYAWTSIAIGMIVMIIYTFVIRKETIPNPSRKLRTKPMGGYGFPTLRPDTDAGTPRQNKRYILSRAHPRQKFESNQHP